MKHETNLKGLSSLTPYYLTLIIKHDESLSLHNQRYLSNTEASRPLQPRPFRTMVNKALGHNTIVCHGTGSMQLCRPLSRRMKNVTSYNIISSHGMRVIHIHIRRSRYDIYQEYYILVYQHSGILCAFVET